MISRQLKTIAEACTKTFFASGVVQNGSSQADKAVRAGAPLAAAGALTLGGLTQFSAAMAEDVAGMHPPFYPWYHYYILFLFDKASVRRGHQVFTEVCSACHSMDMLYYYQMVDVCYTEKEAKAIAAEIEVLDGPDDTGEMFMRPGKLFDCPPNPYANEQAARYANAGALPPDLSLIIKQRHDPCNYLFSLLTGYREPPAGVNVREGLYYNPYFPGGAIGMPKMLVDEGVEFEDGVVATESQMAKDVTTFLAWAGYTELDEKKIFLTKMFVGLNILVWATSWAVKHRWAMLMTRKIIVDTIN